MLDRRMNMDFTPKVGLTFTVTHPTYPGPKRFQIIEKTAHGWKVMNIDTGVEWDVDALWFDRGTRRVFKEIKIYGKPYRGG
jgi:hypothetical protein